MQKTHEKKIAIWAAFSSATLTFVATIIMAVNEYVFSMLGQSSFHSAVRASWGCRTQQILFTYIYLIMPAYRVLLEGVFPFRSPQWVRLICDHLWIPRGSVNLKRSIESVELIINPADSLYSPMHTVCPTSAIAQQQQPVLYRLQFLSEWAIRENVINAAGETPSLLCALSGRTGRYIVLTFPDRALQERANICAAFHQNTITRSMSPWVLRSCLELPYVPSNMSILPHERYTSFSLTRGTVGKNTVPRRGDS